LCNVAEEQPDVVRALKEALHQWLNKTDDPWVQH
jgi:hypothetical protein